MSDLKLVLEILSRIEEAAKRVARRFSKVDSADAFLESEEGLEKLDAEAVYDACEQDIPFLTKTIARMKADLSV